MKLNDPTSVLHGVVSTGATAGLALIDPRKLTKQSRLVYRGALAGLTAWIANTSLKPTKDGAFDIFGPINRVALSTGAAGAMFGLSELSETIDARIHDRIKRAGARRPRLWMAAGTGVTSITSWWLGRYFDTKEFNFDEMAVNDMNMESEQQTPTRTLHEVPKNLRAIISSMLEATDDYGSLKLREQLAAASVYHWNGSAGAFNAGQFHVPNHVPRLIPGNYRFPVIGKFQACGDLTFTIEFWVDEGHLGSVHIEEEPDWTLEQHLRWEEISDDTEEPELIPSPEDVQLLIETSTGYQPVQR